VLTREEGGRLLPLIDGQVGLIVRLLYGSGLRNARLGGGPWRRLFAHRDGAPRSWGDGLEVAVRVPGG
jgi:hypothetical protein